MVLRKKKTTTRLDAPSYWMHLEIPADASLQTLDSFLRKSWLECSGHLSRFEIHGTSYSSYVDPEFGDKSMRVQVGKILEVGDQIVHEYDFGTTTELRLKVLAEREGVLQKKAVELLAHNVPPAIPCDVCGKPATQICSQCIYEEGGWFYSCLCKSLVVSRFSCHISCQHQPKRQSTRGPSKPPRYS